MTDHLPGHDLNYYQAQVENALQQLRFPEKPEELYDPIRYMMALGGKRIRPVLTLIGCDLFSGDIEAALKPALAMEVFHNFTLIHDDIMDNASLRRGKPTVHAQWDTPTAILSGDVMLVLAYDLLSSIEKSKFHAAIALFNETARKVCEGQQLDMVFENNARVSIADYVDMIGLKTAALLGGSLNMGALVAGAAEAECRLIYDFGYTLGIAFQIQDDLLDSFGNEKFGKAIGGDIAANKKTFLTLKALEAADDAARVELLELYSKNGISAAEKIRRVMAIYEKLSIKTLTEEARDAYFDKAMRFLEKINAPAQKKAVLSKLAEELINREK